MSEPFLGEIRQASFGFAPKGWALCNGQLLSIAQNQALFAILGTTYGGDGRTNFALPDLRGRSPAHASNSMPLGSRAGEENHTLTINEVPTHGHGLQGSTDLATSAAPAGNLPSAKGRGGKDIYAAGGSPLQAMSTQSVAPAGNSQPHNNMQPYLAINFIIALQGIFPSRT